MPACGNAGPARPGPAPLRRDKMAAGAPPRAVSIRARAPPAERHWLRRHRKRREAGARGSACGPCVRGSSRTGGAPGCFSFGTAGTPPHRAPCHALACLPRPGRSASIPRLLASPRPPATMFVLVEMTDTVRIPPWQFERKLNESIAEELNKKLANKVKRGSRIG